jgi:hypothetical protein
MTWASVFAAFKTSLWLTPLLMCVIFCGLLLFVGVKEYGWMVLAKVAAVTVFMIVLGAAIDLIVDWIIRWGN